MITKALHFRVISLTLLVISAAFSVTPVYAEPLDQVWAFNHRDSFLDIACLNEQKAVIVGDRGRILITHRKYKNLWAKRDSNTSEMLTSVSFIDDKRGWAAGHGGIIIHTVDGGENWEIQRESSAQNLPLFDIQFVSAEVGYASGAYDTLLKTTDGGKTWSSLPTGADNIYNGLYFHDPEHGFLVGEFGSLLKTSDGGESWQQMNVEGYEGSLFGITFLSSQRALAYGISGKLLVTDDGGENWTDIPTGIGEALFRAAANKDDVLIVGKSGVTLLSHDAGQSFTRKYDPENHSYAGVCARPGGGFVVVGEFGKIVSVEAAENE